MFIESISLDGFKSYAQRTDIVGFDPQFNAITGLNGTGKSNILDAICFVLGITNLSQVRATSLQDLVYKSGQAGISKATVSVTFNNKDRTQSPIGYEHYEEITITRQVVIGGRNKYLINGTNATNQRVADLFRSIQLNVNNPHFLIMQGRITKVLNMKPHEILSMIEEAAGTRMYELKRQAAMKTIEKKDAKLNEITTVLTEEITPTITKLRAEKTAYLEFQRICRELEHLTRLHFAFQYTEAKDKYRKGQKSVREKEEQIDALRKRIETNGVDMGVAEAELAQMEQERDKESDGRIEKQETELKSRQKMEAKALSVLQAREDTLKSEQKKIKDLQKQKTDDQKLITTRQKELEKLEASIADVANRGKRDADELERAQRRLQALNQGKSVDEDGEEATLAEQLRKAEMDLAEADTKIKQSEMKIKHLRPQVQKKENDSRRQSTQSSKEEANYERLTNEIKAIEKELGRLKFDEEAETKLLQDKKDLQTQVNQLRQRLDDFERRNPNLSFHYQDPERNWDRSRVKGLVGRQFELKDANYALAIACTAGGRLYNIIVDTDATSKAILENGRLQFRTTFIPLNKIQPHVIAPDIVNRAKQRVGPNNVQLALSQVNFDRSVKPAMEFVFGNTLVCATADAGKTCCYDKRIARLCVTMDGDTYSPAGTLTGGGGRGKQNQAACIERLQEVIAWQREFDEKHAQLTQIDAQLAQMAAASQQHKRLKHQLELKQQEAENAKAVLQHTAHHVEMEEINRMKQEIADCEEAVKSAGAVRGKSEKKAAELRKKMANATEYREKELRECEKHLNDVRKRAEVSGKQMQEKMQGVDELKMEIADLEKGIVEYETQLAAAERAVEQTNTTIVELRKMHTDALRGVEEVENEVTQLKEALKARNKALQAKQMQIQALRTDTNKSELRVKEVSKEIERDQADIREILVKIDMLRDNYDWITKDEHLFGKAGSIYDFNTTDPKDAARRIQKLTEQKDKLSRTVNMRAMNMLGKAEAQYDDLMKKKETVERDKAKIEQVIVELDNKKREAIEIAWAQVNKDFGSIFSTLLPGTNAKLMPPAGQTALDGLEVRVAFGDIWKDSLGELSGGQRSLVALSLILAMLLFKPAPLYILDEVDAALDLSHTQNIGQLIKTHFKSSQFVIVSLKDGMFNNANVLFKTRFVDGQSMVTRIAQSQNRRLSAGSGATAGPARGAGQSRDPKTKEGKRKHLALENGH